MGKNSTDNLSYENTLEALREKLKDVKNFSQTELDEDSLRIFTSHLIAYCTNLERKDDEAEVKAEKIFEDLNIQPAVIQIHDEHNTCEIDSIKALKNEEIIYIPIFTYKNGEIIKTNLITVEKLENSINVTNFINEKQYGAVGKEVNAVGEVIKVLQENLVDGSEIVKYKNEEINFKTDSSLGSYTIGTQIARLHLEKIKKEAKYLEFFSKAKVNFDTYSIGHLSYFYECAMGAMHSLIHKTKRRGVESGFDLSMPLTRGSVESYEALVEEGQNMFGMYDSEYGTREMLGPHTVHLLSLNMINFFIKHPNFDIADQSQKIDFSQSTPEELQQIFDQITMFDISESPSFSAQKSLFIKHLQYLGEKVGAKDHFMEKKKVPEGLEFEKSKFLTICINISNSINKRKIDYNKAVQELLKIEDDSVIVPQKFKELQNELQTLTSSLGNISVDDRKDPSSKISGLLQDYNTVVPYHNTYKKFDELLKEIEELKPQLGIGQDNKKHVNFGALYKFLNMLSRSIDIDSKIIADLDQSDKIFLENAIQNLYYTNIAAEDKAQTFPFLSTERSAKLENMIKQLDKENGPNLPIFLPFSNGHHHVLVAIVKPSDKYEVLYCNSMPFDGTGYYQAKRIHECMIKSLGKEKVEEKITKYNTKSIQYNNTCGLCVAVFITSIYQKYVLGYQAFSLLGFCIVGTKTLLEKIHDHLPNGEFLRLLYSRFGNPVWELMKQGLGYYKLAQKPEPVLPEPKPEEPPIKQDSEQDKESEAAKPNTWQRFKEGVAELASNVVFYNIIAIGIIVAVVALVALIKLAIDIKSVEMNSTTALHTSVPHTKIPNYTGDKARYNISPAALERVKNAGTKGLPGGGHSK